MQNMKNSKILVTGGGSGGHLTSANTLIEAMINEYMISPQDIIYVGGDLAMEDEKTGNSIEQKLMIGKEFKIYFIRAGKLQRKLSLKTIKLLFRSILGFIDSYRIFKKEKPNIVISTGGFVSVPVCIIAWIFKKNIYLHEQTVTVGLSNKIVGKIAKKIYISFKNSAKYFSKNKTYHTGNILRKDIFLKEKTLNTDSNFIQLFEQNSQYPLIYISGGSLGSHVINMKVLSELNSLLEKYRVLFQTGDNRKLKEYELALQKKEELDEQKQQRLLITKYINSENIGYVLNTMDLFLGRSGANTVYELGVLGKNAIFIPIPWVTHNEQYLNAKVLEDIGTAKILEEKYLKNTSLLEECDRFEQQIKIRTIDKERLEAIFPVNAVSKILSDIFLNERV